MTDTLTETRARLRTEAERLKSNFPGSIVADGILALLDSLDAKDAEIARLRAALRPFAAMAKVLDCRSIRGVPEPTRVFMEVEPPSTLADEEPDDRDIFTAAASAPKVPATYMWTLVLGDFRQARAALEQST